MVADSLRKQADLAEQTHEQFGKSIPNQLAIFDQKIAIAQSDFDRESARLKSLQVYSGVNGVLAQVPVEVGQQFTEGELLAKIVNPKKLKAELRVPEVEARYVRVGQKASVDTHNGITVGTVVRIDPEVTDGSMTIHVTFGDAELPEEVRPDMTVVGMIEIKRLPDVIWVGRPASAMSVSKDDIFLLTTDDRSNSKRALRVPVQYGIASANAIVIEDGLKEGDQVIRSVMSDFDGTDEVILK